MISWVIRLLRKESKEQQILDTYRSVGRAIGYAWVDLGVTSVYIQGHDIDLGDPELFHLLDALEESYSELGYRIIPFQDWIDYGGWGVSIDDLWLIKREENERPQFTKHTARPERPQRHPLWKTFTQ